MLDVNLKLFNTSCHCISCNKDVNPFLLLEGKDNPEGSQIYNILRCPECKLTFVYPKPSEESIKNYYIGMYSDLAMAYNAQKMAWARNSIREYTSVLLRKNKKTETRKILRLLDLGGGLGYYSKAFQEAGFDVTLVEPDPISAEFAITELGVDNVITKSFENYFNENTDEFDVVFLRHVIEHVKDPCDLIKRISDVLVANGQLILETDNNSGIELLLRPGTASFYINLYRKAYKNCNFLSLLIARPFAVDPPRHLYGFRINNLNKILNRYKLGSYKVVYYRTGDRLYWPNLPFPTVRQLLSRLKRGYFGSFLKDLVDVFVYPLIYLTQFTRNSAGICLYVVKVTESNKGLE